MKFRLPTPTSLFWKIFAGLLTVILVTAAAVWGAAYYSSRQQEVGQLDLRWTGQKAVELALSIHHFGGRDALIEWLKSDVNRRPTVYVISDDGSELSGRPIPKPALSSLEQIGKARTGSENPIKTIEIDGRPHLLIAAREELPPPRVNPLPFFHIRFPTDVALATLFVLTLLVSTVLALYYTRPLRRLDAAMRRFAQGEFHTRASPGIAPADSEVAALALVFDQMAEHIEQLVRRQRRLFHDVSHEVRSPLARIAVAVDLARLDEKRTKQCLERIEREVDAIDRLIEGLLTYARYDEGPTLQKTRISMRRVHQTVLEMLAFEAEPRQVRVLAEDRLSGDVGIFANEDALLSAVSNIARNALRHSPKGGTVRLRLQESGDSVEWACADEGPGIPENELEQIFSPFVRGSKESTGTGFGLGLAIAQSAVRAHGGLIRAKNIQPHGLEVIISIPKTPAPKHFGSPEEETRP